jgi:hypothetical protein
MQTAAGPLALPPTEHTSYDVEVDIREAYLDLHRHIYRFQVRRTNRLSHILGISCVAIGVNCGRIDQQSTSNGVKSSRAPYKCSTAPQGFDPHVVELMLEALRVETAAQEDFAAASLCISTHSAICAMHIAGCLWRHSASCCCVK